MSFLGWLIALVIALVAGGFGGAVVIDARRRKEIDREKELFEARQREVNEKIDAIDRAYPDDPGRRVLEKARARLAANGIPDPGGKKPDYTGADRRRK